MRHAIELLVFISLSLGIDSATADDRGWYIGIGVGGVVADYGIADFDDGSISEGLVDNSDIDDTTGYFIAVIGSLPMTGRLDLIAKGGVVAWRAQQTTLDLDQRDLTLDDTDTHIGIGMEYRLDNGIGVRGEAERYFNMGATDQAVVALSIVYNF